MYLCIRYHLSIYELHCIMVLYFLFSLRGVVRQPVIQYAMSSKECVVIFINELMTILL